MLFSPVSSRRALWFARSASRMAMLMRKLGLKDVVKKSYSIFFGGDIEIAMRYS